MNHRNGTELADRIEGASPNDPEFAHAALLGLAEAFPEDAGTDAIGPAAIVSTDAALALVRRKLPGWSIEIEGSANAEDGHWRCLLRKSEVRDDDMLIGVGKGRNLQLALIAALLRVAARRAQGYS
jgi:hypothetical protein